MPDVTAHPTPNPNSLKFTLDGARFTEEKHLAFTTPEEAAEHPLGNALFAVRGVTNVFIVPDFATITKHPAASWDLIVPAVEQIVQEHVGSADA